MSKDNDKVSSISKKIEKYRSFERMIFKCFKEKYGNRVHIFDEAKDNYYDMIARDGLDFFNEEKRLLIEIKYSDQINPLIMYLNHIRHCKDITDNNFLIIGLWNYRTISIVLDKYNNPNNIKIMGRDYVNQLTSDYNWLKWEYAGETYDSPKIDLSNDGKTLVLSPTSEELYSPEINFDIKNISEISNRFESIFKSLIRESKKEPALIVGNGASIPFGADSWLQMSKYIYDYIYPYYIDSPEIVRKIIGDSNYTITSIAKTLLPSEMYYSAVYNCIYRKYNKNMHTPYTLIRSIVEAKNNHINMPVFTYNYDCFIEYDYEKYGGKTLESISSLRKFKKVSEPRIVHIHGLIDFKKRKMKKIQNNIVLTADDYFNAYKGKNWVSEKQIELLKNNICLYVGSSMSDIYQMSLIDKVKKDQSEKINGWKCFALMCLNDATDKDIFSIITYYLKKGVYVIFVRKFEELPNKLNNLMKY